MISFSVHVVFFDNLQRQNIHDNWGVGNFRHLLKDWYEDDLVRAAHTGYLADKDNNAPVIFLDDPQRLGNQESDGAV